MKKDIERNLPDGASLEEVMKAELSYLRECQKRAEEEAKSYKRQAATISDLLLTAGIQA